MWQGGKNGGKAKLLPGMETGDIRSFLFWDKTDTGTDDKEPYQPQSSQLVGTGLTLVAGRARPSA